MAKKKPAPRATKADRKKTTGAAARAASRSPKKGDAPAAKSKASKASKASKSAKSAKGTVATKKADKKTTAAKGAKAPAKAAAPKKPSKAAVAKPTKPAKDAKKKAPAKQAVEKKAPEKKAPEKKAPAAKPEAKPSGKKAAASKSTKGGKAGKGAEAASNKPRTDVSNRTTSLADARAAASRLAAAAGLKLVKPKAGDDEMFEPAAKPLTKSPLSKKELNHYREILLQKRGEVAGDVNAMESEALTGSGSLSSFPQHLADQGSDEYDQSLSLGLAESQRKLLVEIDAALVRIENGTYGVCEALGTPISAERLEATPWARYSVEGARMLDRRAMFR